MDRWNFRNAKKNILSSSRGRNARRSVNPWRRQRRNGKSWHNTAEERKFLFSRRRKETESEDKNNYKMLESLDFNFRRQSHKVAEAGLMFCYEIGTEGRQLYIVALTEKFGTIVFYIPEEMAGKIKKRVQQLPYTLNDYLSFLIEFKDFEPIVIPFRKCRISIKEVATVLGKLSAVTAQAGIKIQNTAEALKTLTEAYGEMKKNQKRVSNNWLKMHGFPMRRKGRGEKKRE